MKVGYGITVATSGGEWATLNSSERLIFNFSDEIIKLDKKTSVDPFTVIHPDGSETDFVELEMLGESVVDLSNGYTFDITGTWNDDFVNLSGLDESYFNQVGGRNYWQALEVDWTSGQDVYIAPNLDGNDGKFYAANYADLAFQALRTANGLSMWDDLYDLQMYVDDGYYSQRSVTDYIDDLYDGLYNINNGLLFQTNDDGSATVSELVRVFGDTTELEGFDHFSGTFFNDTFLGGDGHQNFRSIGGHDTMTGGGGMDTFRIEYTDYWGGFSSEYSEYLNYNTNYYGSDRSIYITDYEDFEFIRIEEFGMTFSSMDMMDQLYTAFYDEDGNGTIDLTTVSLSNEMGTYNDLVVLDGEWHLYTAYDDGDGIWDNATIKLLSTNVIEGTNRSDDLAPYGDLMTVDPENMGDFSFEIYGYGGFDDIAGGGGSDYLDGGSGSDFKDEFGRDANENGTTIRDRVFYFDSVEGIVGNLSDQGTYLYDQYGNSTWVDAHTIIDGFGYGGIDTVLGFEQVQGSYYDDNLILTTDQYRGYTPLYGNDTVHVVSGSSEAPGWGMYLGYWNLWDGWDTDGYGYESMSDPEVTGASVIFDFDTGTAEKTIFFDGYQNNFTDTISGLYTGFVGAAAMT